MRVVKQKQSKAKQNGETKAKQNDERNSHLQV